MRRLVTLLTIVATALLLSIPAASETGTTKWSGESGQPGQNESLGQPLYKDTCLLVAKNCSIGFDSVQTRVDKLRAEIDKGASVYTPEELDQLNNQLIWLYSEGSNIF